jgi:hypothetical protein
MEFKYDGKKLSFEVEADPSLAMKLMTAINRVFMEPQDTGQGFGATDFIIDFLRKNPSSSWSEIKYALDLAGLSTHMGNLTQLVHRQRVVKDDTSKPARYSAVEEEEN